MERRIVMGRAKEEKNWPAKKRREKRDTERSDGARDRTEDDKIYSVSDLKRDKDREPGIQ